MALGFGNSSNRRDEEEGQTEGYDKFVRLKFVRTVYFILLIQLAVTLGIILLFRFIDIWCYWVLTHSYFWYILMAVSFVVLIMIVCCGKLRHMFPINLILLATFTIVEGIILGGLTCTTSSNIFLMAVGITAAVSLALSLFAIQTRCDFTIFGGVMLVFVIVLMIMGIVQFFVRDRILHLVYASLGALIFSIYLVIDTQMILGGNHKYSLEPDEYILGALHLYIDIVMMFMFIYSIIMGSQ